MMPTDINHPSSSSSENYKEPQVPDRNRHFVVSIYIFLCRDEAIT